MTDPDEWLLFGQSMPESQCSKREPQSIATYQARPSSTDRSNFAASVVKMNSNQGDSKIRESPNGTSRFLVRTAGFEPARGLPLSGF